MRISPISEIGEIADSGFGYSADVPFDVWREPGDGASRCQSDGEEGE